MSAAAKTVVKASSAGRSNAVLQYCRLVPIGKPSSNPLLFPMTLKFLADRTHPYNIKTHRRVSAFDPSKLHIRVTCPYNVSRKARIRNWAKRRVHRAFEEELREAGWHQDGSPRESGKVRQLSGALIVALKSDPAVALTTPYEQIRAQAAESIRKSIIPQSKGGLKRNPYKIKNQDHRRKTAEP